MACSNCSVVCNIISTSALRCLLLFTQTLTRVYSSLVMKLLLYCVVSCGVYGLVSLSWPPGPSSVKSGTSSKLSCWLIKLQNSFLKHSAFKYCCRARGEKLERTNIFYACLARVVRDGGFKIALIARLSAIPGHCKAVLYIVFVSNSFRSYYCGLLGMWHGYHRIFPCCDLIYAKAVHHCLSGRYFGAKCYW